ncbi:MAG: ion transporter [Chitinophagales bacterium]|nr:ion transporter [Bacteroidota bacterium]MCB9256315.1 ion transporter [Chitinophagales bacterium]
MQKVFDFCKKLAEASWFQGFIIFIILLAGVVVGIQTYEVSGTLKESWLPTLHLLDLIILAIFTVEVVVKMLAEGKKPWNYFKDGWNIFDFAIVAVALYAILPGVEINASFIAVLRLARIFRVFKLVTAIPKLQVLVGALIKSIPSMGYVGILLSILFYIYATMSVFFFGENDPLHFGTLERAMLSLFRIVTLEDWTDIMYIQMWGCNHEIWGYSGILDCPPNANGFGWPAALFFVSFVLIGTMIVLNLFIGVIMNSMDEAKAEAELEENIKRKEEGNVSTGDDLHAIMEKLDELKKEMDFVYNRMKKEK